MLGKAGRLRSRRFVVTAATALTLLGAGGAAAHGSYHYCGHASKVYSGGLRVSYVCTVEDRAGHHHKVFQHWNWNYVWHTCAHRWTSGSDYRC
jgi:hypothetical protein